MEDAGGDPDRITVTRDSAVDALPDECGGDECFVSASDCKDVWTTDDAPACEVPQFGCPSTPCDGWHAPWCMVDEGDGWCYCG